MTTNSLITDGATSTSEAAQQQQGAEGGASASDDASKQQQPNGEGNEGNQTDKGAGDSVQKAGEDDKAKAEGDKAKDAKQGAPEKYEDFNFGEGVQVDAELVGEFSNIAKELGLNQEGAQKLAEIGGKMAQKFATKQTDVLTEAITEWKGQVAADKEIGGDNLSKNLATAKKALDTFGTPALRELLVQSGLGNHPEIIRAFYRAGVTISEDTLVGQGSDKTAPKDPADVLFPNQKKTA